MTIGFIPDPQTGNPLTKPDGMPLGAGDCWKIDQKEAKELGDAWAEVIALYAPPELVERGAILGTAITTTGMVLLTRVYADVQTQAMIKQVNMMREEGMFNRPPAQSPNGMPTYTGMDFSQTPQTQPEG